MEGLSKAKADLTVYVHPSRTDDVHKAVLRQLGSLLFQYDEVFDGVLLAYEANVEGDSGKILSGLFPYVGVKVQANLLLFTPKPNMFVEGKVVKLGKESIHVIILGFSSASILSEDIRSEFKYKIKDGAGAFYSTHQKHHVIRDGSTIRFLIKSFDEETLHMYGSLADENTGCIRWLFKHCSETSRETESNLNRDAEKYITKEMQEQDPRVHKEHARLSDSGRPHKSRKKHAVE